MALPEWLESGAAIAGIVSGVIAVLGLAGLYFAAHPHIEKRLAHNAEYRARRAKQLREVSYFGLYRRNLERALAWLQEVMGPPWSPRAFGVCLTLAFFYASLFLCGSWLFAGAEAGLAESTFLPQAPIWMRGVMVFGVILYI